MRKNLILSFIVSGIIFGSIGYLVAYCRGLRYANDMVMRTHCEVLILQSVSYLNSSDVASLIDKVEENGNCLASILAVNETYFPEDIKKNISEALEKWEKAKRKLEEYTYLHKGQKD
jgi:hypothetical protein